MKNTKTYVVILNWNGEKDTEKCVLSMKKLKAKNFEIVIVDNNSEPKSVNYLRERFPKIKIIENTKNLGFAGGNNVGIRFAKENRADYAIILNNDTKVKKGWLKGLLDTVESDVQIGIVGSKAMFMGSKGVIQTAGIIRKGDYYEDRGFGEKDEGQFDVEMELDAVSGVSMLINLSMPEELIYFDEKFFMYSEDIELCLRVQKHDYKVMYAPKSVFLHKFSASSDKVSGLKVYYGLRNKLRVIRKYHSFSEFTLSYLKGWARGFLNIFTFDGTLIFNHFKALLTVK
ncbi:MAG TPA: glycosyltransferase family 2 protein [bacterium]|nr:glycosyltransferase family 2 protein [bacterium]